ncbi:MAG TPA: diaminopropionate ammonia-lyase [Bacteroidales bacterium]|nr:diaminopropionate ammonia-lyase [Bacteroidales bacterium]
MSKKYYKNTPNNIITNEITNRILKNNDASIFHTSLDEYIPTSLISLPSLSKKYGVENIYIKDESLRFGLKAFKVLGASYALFQCLQKNPAIETFCTATDGNHGRAVAWSAKKFGKSAVIFVPKDTTINRIRLIESDGAMVIKINGNYDEACQQAEKLSKINNWTLIQDMAWEGYEEIPAFIMAGYLTLFKELEDSLHTNPKPKIDIVFLQAGVGSLAGAGIYYYLNKYGNNRPKIVIVEPEEADPILFSFKRNKISTTEGNCTTIMAGLNCGTPSTGAWNLIKNGADYSVKISDKYAKQAMRELYYPTNTDKRIISGESGVGGLAGFLAIMNENSLKTVRQSLNIGPNTNILFISTEGDTDEQVFEQIINEKINEE